MKTKRIVLLTAAVAAALVAAMAVPAYAHGGDEGGGGDGATPGQQVQVFAEDVTWTIVPGQCPELDEVAPGLTITGTTVRVDLLTITTRRNGLTSVTNESHAVGLATDDQGHRYQFFYDNTVNQTNSKQHPSVFEGRMVDEFRLDGDGPVHLHNGFRAVVTDDRTDPDNVVSSLVPKSEFGHPFDFANDRGMCDPM
jgi:hypothetical protein